MPADDSTQFRKLPQVDRLSAGLGLDAPAPLRVAAAREAIKAAHEKIAAGAGAPPYGDLLEDARARLAAGARRRLTPVINATGVLLHTNLGRAPLAPQALGSVSRLAGGYSNLEYDLETGTRGSRYAHARGLLKQVTGAEAALVVNNNAAAVLLALAVLSRGREAVVSRGELIEIGGEFRIPDIMAESGAVMREVGTTNRTHLKDYQRAIGPETAVIVKVHPSNYRVEGFTAQVGAAELAQLCREKGLALIHDLGSGLLRRDIGGRRPGWLAQEPCVAEQLAHADLLTISADKLMGGPQAGIILGTQTVIDRLQRSPLLRTFRVDKMTLAALEATLFMYLQGEEAELPFWKMALLEPEQIQTRAEALAARLGALKAKIDLLDGFSTPGGGSTPGAGIPTVLLEVRPTQVTAADLHRALIDADPPAVCRIEDEALLIDLRTVEPAADDLVASALQKVL